MLLALTGREGSHTPPNSTTPNKSAPAAAAAASQAPTAAQTQQSPQQPAKQSRPPAAQGTPASSSGAIVTPTGEDTHKRKRAEDDISPDPSPSSAAPGIPQAQRLCMHHRPLNLP